MEGSSLLITCVDPTVCTYRTCSMLDLPVSSTLVLRLPRACWFTPNDLASSAVMYSAIARMLVQHNVHHVCLVGVSNGSRIFDSANAVRVTVVEQVRELRAKLRHDNANYQNLVVRGFVMSDDARRAIAVVDEE